jgi:hypothetical protein
MRTEGKHGARGKDKNRARIPPRAGQARAVAGQIVPEGAHSPKSRQVQGKAAKPSPWEARWRSGTCATFLGRIVQSHRELKSGVEPVAKQNVTPPGASSLKVVSPK